VNILFLPGAGGDPTFWRPVADRLPANWNKTLLGWPGLGNQPHDPAVNSWDDLYRSVERRLQRPIAIVAQSMGGMLALRAAVAHPHAVSHLVLTAAAGGIDLAPFGAVDWRPEYRNLYPSAAQWVYERAPANDAALGGIVASTLLIWAARDPTSPPAVGRHLAALLPNAQFVELDDDSHVFAKERPDDVGRLIARHLGPVADPV